MHTNFKCGKWRALETVQYLVEVSKLVSGDEYNVIVSERNDG